MRRQHHQLPNRQRGAVAVVVGLAIVVLVGFLGLVIDLGRMFVIKTELQNSTDACALAAAQELNGENDALERAVAAGSVVGNRNSANFQSVALSFDSGDISFSPNLDGTYRTIAEGAVAASAEYAKCTMPMGGITTYFIRVLNLLPGVSIGPQTVSAFAVATLKPAATACLVPLGFCSKPIPSTCPGGEQPSIYGHCPGKWYDGRFDAGGGVTGSFNWIDFTPQTPGDAPCNGTGTSELACLLEGTGYCGATVGMQVGSPGNLGNAAAQSWNTRFGLYMSGEGNPQASTAVPDFTGYAYTPTNWSTEFNALGGPSSTVGAQNFNTNRLAHFNYNGGVVQDKPDTGNAITGLDIGNQYKASSGGDLGTHGIQGADRRMVSVPIMDCSEWEDTNSKAEIKDVACVLLLHPIAGPGDIVRMEYVGLASEPGSPCSTFGSGPGTTGGPQIPVLVQ